MKKKKKTSEGQEKNKTQKRAAHNLAWSPGEPGKGKLSARSSSCSRTPVPGRRCVRDACGDVSFTLLRACSAVSVRPGFSMCVGVGPHPGAVQLAAGRRSAVMRCCAVLCRAALPRGRDPGATTRPLTWRWAWRGHGHEHGAWAWTWGMASSGRLMGSGGGDFSCMDAYGERKIQRYKRGTETEDEGRARAKKGQQ